MEVGGRSRGRLYTYRFMLLLLYSAILHSWAESLLSHVIIHERLALYSAFWNSHQSGVLTALAWLVPHETAAIWVQVPCTPYNHAPCHLMQSHIRKVYARLAVTCHMHFWQSDQDLLHATVVTQVWNGYQNTGEENSPAAPAGIETCNLSITSPFF